MKQNECFMKRLQIVHLNAVHLNHRTRKHIKDIFLNNLKKSG